MTDIHDTPICLRCGAPTDPDTHTLHREEERAVYCPRCGFETPAPDHTAPGVLNAALRYAELGYPVLPIEPGEKRPHHLLAPRGIKNATRNPLILRSWLSSFPDCNLALAVPQGVLGLDFDSRDEAERFLSRFPELELAPKSLSPRGVHLWLASTVDAELRTRSPRGLPSFEVKRPGKAYLLEYPSKTASGSYTWVNPLVRPSELPPIPLDLLRALSVRRTSTPAIRHGVDQRYFERILLEFRLTATPGNRHNSLITAAAKMQAASAPGEVFERLAQAAYEVGLPPHEVRSALQWAQGTVQPQVKPAPARSIRSLFHIARRRATGGHRDR